MADKKRGVGEEGGAGGTPTFGPRSYQDGRQHTDIVAVLNFTARVPLTAPGRGHVVRSGEGPITGRQQWASVKAWRRAYMPQHAEGGGCSLLRQVTGSSLSRDNCHRGEVRLVVPVAQSPHPFSHCRRAWINTTVSGHTFC